jgi:hypothetical protein
MADQKPAPTVQVSIRIDAADLQVLERLGREAKPVPADRDEMIGAAVREYVERHTQPSGSGESSRRDISSPAEDSSRRETLRRAGVPLDPAKGRKRK